MSFLFLALTMQAAPPVIDPILEPRRERDLVEESRDDSVVNADRLVRCIRLADSDPQAALAEGARWLLDNGGMEAELCVATGHEASGQWQDAEAAYLRAAGHAERSGDPRRGAFVANAGRAALARGEAALAKSRFDEVLAGETLSNEIRGNVLAERARAHVALDDGNAAQGDLIAAQSLLPNDPAIWLLSATLARRQGDLDAAGDFIDRALELDQADPAILLEAGNIAIRLNAYDIARQAWGRAAAADPGGTSGLAASRNIERLEALLADDSTVPVELPETDEAESANGDSEAPDS